MSDITLKNATRNELIEELKSRVSISKLYVPKGKGAVITGFETQISVSGGNYIFVIEPNAEDSANLEMNEILVTSDDNEVIACVYKEEGEIRAFMKNGYKTTVDNVELQKENTTTENNNLIIRNIKIGNADKASDLIKALKDYLVSIQENDVLPVIDKED